MSYIFFFLGGMDGVVYYDEVLEYDDVSWKIIGKMSLARKAHAVSVVQYDDVCPSGWKLSIR